MINSPNDGMLTPMSMRTKISQIGAEDQIGSNNNVRELNKAVQQANSACYNINLPKSVKTVQLSKSFKDR